MTQRPSQVKLPYTAAGANRALPLVRRIVDDLVACYAEWQAAVSRFEYATTGSRAEQPDPDAARLEAEAQALAAQIQGFVNELQELGLECRALDTGLIDFPGELDGRAVYFCWMHGEPRVEHWHEVGAGFNGRQQLHDSELARK
jgi:hypothetical protein